MTPDETANTARDQVLNELLLRKQQRKKDWNKNIRKYMNSHDCYDILNFYLRVAHDHDYYCCLLLSFSSGLHAMFDDFHISWLMISHHCS